ISTTLESFLNVVGFSAHLLRHPLDTLGGGIGDIWGDFKNWAASKATAAHGGNPNWRNGPMAPVKATAHVHVTVRNATGADLHTSVNNLNGGAG
ncbi:MAG: hypothetical protein KGL37_00880, partial [Acidobacteriota bacterium]|nr:hypothetical protein [Acidobacteriota bacterium]